MPTASELQVSVGTTSGGFIPGSDKRIGLIIIPGLVNRFTFSLKGVAVLDQGITLYPGTAPFNLRKDIHGDCVNHPWQGISAVGAQTITVIEIFP